jgi:hypothetical protein
MRAPSRTSLSLALLACLAAANGHAAGAAEGPPPVPVTVERAQAQSLGASITATGEVASRHDAEISTEVAGRLVWIAEPGATVGSDGLALLARQDPVSAGHVGDVVHAAPDADFRGFVDDMKVYAGSVWRVTTLVNLGDSALRLAAVVNRGSRAGRPDLRELTPEATDWLLAAADDEGLEIVQVHPEVMPELSATSHTFWYDDPWVSNDVLVTLFFHLAPAARGLDPGAAASGTRYWTFPADYTARMPAVLEAVRAKAAAEPAPG